MLHNVDELFTDPHLITSHSKLLCHPTIHSMFGKPSSLPVAINRRNVIGCLLIARPAYSGWRVFGSQVALTNLSLRLSFLISCWH